MDRHTIASLALALPGLFFSAAGAASQDLDLNLSSDAIRGEFAFDVGGLPNNNAKVAIGGLFSEDLEPEDLTAIHAGLLVTGDTGARDALVEAGLGVRIVALDVADSLNGAAIALGGEVDARLPAFNRIGVSGYVYYAPDVSSFSDINQYIEYAFDANYEIIRNAFVYLGYRQVRLDIDEAGDFTADTGLHAGFRLRF